MDFRWCDIGMMGALNPKHVRYQGGLRERKGSACNTTPKSVALKRLNNYSLLMKIMDLGFRLHATVISHCKERLLVISQASTLN